MRFSWVEPDSVDNLLAKGHASNDPALRLVEPVPYDGSSVLTVNDDCKVLRVMREGSRSNHPLLRRIIPASFRENVNLVLFLFEIRSFHVVKRNKSTQVAVMLLTYC